MREEINNLRTIAEEWGGRMGIFRTPDSPEDLSEGIIVRVIDQGEEEGSAFVLTITRMDGLEWRLLMRRADLDWVIANPIEEDDQ